MSVKKTLILVTGDAGSGKSTLLSRLSEKLRKTHRVGGFVMRGIGRTRPELFGAAERYELVPVAKKNQPGSLWADRDGETCVFREETRAFAEQLVGSELSEGGKKRPEVMFIDEIGRLELSGKGFAGLLRRALDSEVPILIVSLKKKALSEIVEAFGLQAQDTHLFDLTPKPPAGEALEEGGTTEAQESSSPPESLTPEARSEAAFREILSIVRALDSERIGAFAGLAGLVEVGLGSMLRALHVPLKGHFLAYLQNVLLITFGKSLSGRGLFRISFISAMLKAFSPVGGTIRPMLYIFLQGSAFALPVALFGFNFAGVILGSVLMACLTLTMKLLVDFLVFGMALFDAYAGAIAQASQWADVHELSLPVVIAGAFVLKSLIAALLAALAYLGDMGFLVEKLRVRPRWMPAPRLEDGEERHPQAKEAERAASGAGAPDDAQKAPQKKSLKKAAGGALRDILNWKFALFFFISVLLMLFFANLGTADLLAVSVRGLCISYVGFLAIRSVDFYRLGVRLDRRFHLGLEKSLPRAMEALSLGRALEKPGGSGRLEGVSDLKPLPVGLKDDGAREVGSVDGGTCGLEARDDAGRGEAELVASAAGDERVGS